MNALRKLVFALAGFVAVAVTAAENYSVQRRYLSADRSRYVDEVIYYDGLGRPVETVQRSITPQGQSLVALQEYDEAGRPVRAWQPVVGDGSFMGAEAVRQASMSLYGDAQAYSTTIYQKSPTEIVEGMIRPGSMLVSTPVTVRKYVNDGSSEFRAVRFGVSESGLLVNEGLWVDGMLVAEKTVDEDGRTLIEFTDAYDRRVLSRQLVNGSEYADTYFVYDDYGDLRYIVPPLASDEVAAMSSEGSSWGVSDAVVDNYCYYYEKNILGQVTLFKQPGRAATIYRYDALNRLTLTQDGNQRVASKWTFTFTDRFGRDVACGAVTLSSAEVEAILSDSHVARFTGTGAVSGYEIEGNTAKSDAFFRADVVSYYDNYDFIPSTRLNDFGYHANEYSDASHTSAMGRLTGTLISGKLTSVYYDIYGNEVQRHADNHLGYTDHQYCTYSYTDRPLTVRRETNISPVRTVTESFRYTYDTKDRPLAVYHSLDGADEVCLQSNSYNELLQVASQSIGSSTTRTMSYDLQGRLTSIVSDVFTNRLTYEREGCMSGNISVQEWRHGNSVEEQYSYSYDLLNRLTGADYSGLSQGRYSTSYTYDKMGNPLTLRRRGVNPSLSGEDRLTEIDRLAYTYNGHHISTIEDHTINIDSEGYYDFDYAESGEEYEYDSNGNLSYDPDRGMSFSYDRNNMPLTIRQSKGAMANGLILTQYGYDAAGTRQSVNHTVPIFTGSAPSDSELPPALQLQTTRRDYVGSCILNYYQLERILIPGGYIDADGKYYFYHTDYQGNNRAVVDAEGYVAQRTDYYPYGLPMRQKSADAQPYKYSGKEFDPINGLNTYDFHARVYHPDKSVFGSPDIYDGIFPHISPYCYCLSNPISFIDRDGKHPVYNKYGEFLGVDNFGLSGPFIVMDEENFYNGMPADVAMKNDVRDEVSDEVLRKIKVHYAKLKYRPDYDGFVTISEGIKWAKKHPYAKDNPTPDNMLYIDTSKLDWGALTTKDFEGNLENEINLYSGLNTIYSIFNSKSIATTYALGNVELKIQDYDKRKIMIINSSLTDYDWNYVEDKYFRNTVMFIHNIVTGIDDNKHGFKVFYYGSKSLNYW